MNNFIELTVDCPLCGYMMETKIPLEMSLEKVVKLCPVCKVLTQK